jgi:general secretion pathway protein J
VSRGPAGFTLLELTVALAIFAVLSTLSYGGLRQVLDARVRTEAVADRLSELQLAVRMIVQDLEQVAPREVRDGLGDRQAALLAREDADFALELTSASGWNPAGAPRSSLRRVAYGLQRGTLRRYTWEVLDRAQDSRPHATDLLTGVRRVGVRFLDPARTWQTQWPLVAGGGGSDALPAAVELTLELEDWGVVQRLVRLPG